MEEISSLDSFHTDGESTTQNEVTTSKEDDNAECATTAIEQTSENTAISSNTDEAKDENPGINHNDDNEDDFEQISEGTFDVDDISQGTTTSQPQEEGVKNLPESKSDPIDKPNELQQQTESAPQEEDINESNTSLDANPLQQDDVQQAKAEDKISNVEGETADLSHEHGEQQMASQSENFEEVDANVSTQTTGEQADEKNMLGEADNTLQLEEADETNDKVAQEDEEIEEMDVDEGENKYEQQDSTSAAQENDDAGSLDDIEMASPADADARDVDTVTMEEEHLDDTIDTSYELDAAKAAEETEKSNENTATTGDEETETGRDVVDVSIDESAVTEADKTDEATIKNVESEIEQPTANEQTQNTPAEADANVADEDDAEQEDEPVENVQEPEESDVCLIPDDTETQMTDAEKEQAILAREEAEKANEEAELAEKAEKAAAAAAADKQAEILEQQVDETATKETTTTHEQAEDAAAQAVDKVGAGATATEDAHASTNATTAGVADLPDPDEPLLEEMHPSTVGDAALAKIIISWTVTNKQRCKQCSEQKMCGFRLKSVENPEQYEYLCGQSCCDALIAANPGKFFIRRKKFLVDEISMDGASENATYFCIQCKATKDCKYNFKQDDECFYICNDDCFNLLNVEEPDKYKLKRHSIRVRNIGTTSAANSSTVAAKQKAANTPAESRVINRTAAEAEAARLERAASFQRRCADCFKEVTIGERNLLWETMDFCNEICLGKYQRTIGANCQTCHGEVPNQALGKYCVRFGFDIRQFCCAACLNEFKKGLKTCSCCQKDISAGTEGFLAPVGDKEQFKDFCSQTCMRRYDSMCNPKKKLRNDICAVCNNDKPVRVEIILDDTEHTFCSNPCFSAFKFVSNIVADQCGMCTKYFERKGTEAYTVYTEHRVKVFCSRICLNVYIIVNRRIVSCQWCKVKKYNFDMIYKKQDTQEVLMCSLNCLTLYGVSLNAFSRTTTCCDNCNKLATPQYHLTMSDASMRNFCTYQCVMQFQNQFARAPLTLDTDSVSTQPKVSSVTNMQGDGAGSANKNNAPFPTGLPKRVKLKQQQQPGVKIKLPGPKTVNASKKGPTVPVISAVSSLASGETETMIGSVSVRRGGVRVRKMDSSPPRLASPISQTASTTSNTNNARGRPRKNVPDYRQRSPTPPPPPPPPQSSTNSSTSGTQFRAGRPRKTVPDYRQDTPSPPVSMSSPPPLAPMAASSARPNVSANAKKTSSAAQTETKIVTVPPYPPTVRNVQTSCRPQTVTVGFQAAPKTIDVGVQTMKDYSNKVLIPIPVPIYIPQPMYMYSAPFPVPVPIPLPIPVPIFVPTTRNSAQGILKEIKKIQDKMPTDPLEAELLMMAEMVADDKTNSDSDSEDEVKPDPAVVNMQYTNNIGQQHQTQPEQQQTHQMEVPNNAYGEDMLQMALKMATGEYDQPTMDLESAMTANTITNPPPGLVVAAHDDGMAHMNVHHMQQVGHQMLDSQRGRGRKRGGATSPVSPRNSRSPVKRARLQDLENQSQQQQQTQLIQNPVHMQKPDANMCLKYTFGVNAWKQWVVSKNADIEKSSIRRRTFKTELLQMTADELNYSLCLFVKEVRKPNGTEYAPDTIYYLVLGIQQYLYENGRIDNIFTDPYYERFTDCLDEVARKFSVLYNDSQYIVTRVEEEHLWECKQLGAHSPHVLLSTLMFFNTKHFNLTTVEEHMQLSFSHIMKHWKRTAQNAKVPGTRNVLLRFYPPQAGLDANPRKKKVYEQQENEENPLRCPVRLYEFYLSKCPESVKTRNDVFYLQPERSCVPDSPVWYSTQALSKEALQKMLQRVKMVKEINIALLTS